MFTVNNLLYEAEFVAEVSSYYPARPAPDCSNHDSPAYSDPGDDEEIEYELFVQMVVNGKIIKLPLPSDKKYELLVADIYRALDDDVREGARNDHEKNSIAYALEMKS